MPFDLAFVPLCRGFVDEVFVVADAVDAGVFVVWLGGVDFGEELFGEEDYVEKRRGLVGE